MTTVHTSDNGWPEGVPDTSEVAHTGYRQGMVAEAAVVLYTRAHDGHPPPYLVRWRGWLYAPEVPRES